MKQMMVTNFVDFVVNTRLQSGVYAIFCYLNGSTLVATPIFEVNNYGVTYMTDWRDIYSWMLGPWGNNSYCLWTEAWGPNIGDFWTIRIAKNPNYAGTNPPVGPMVISALTPISYRQNEITSWW